MGVAFWEKKGLPCPVDATLPHDLYLLLRIDSTPGPEVVRMAQPSVRVGMKRPMPQFVYYSEQAGVGTRRAVTEDAVLLNERTANDQVEGLSPSSKVHPETITRGGKKYTLDRAEGSTFPVSFLQSKRPTTSCSSAAREALVAGTAGTTIAASTVKPAIKTAREQALLAAAMGFDGNNIDQILRMINVNLVTTAGQTRNNERESVEQGPPSASKEQQQRVALGGATTTRVSSSSNTRTPPVSADAFLSTTDEPRDAVKRNLTDQFLSVEEKTRSPDRYVFQEEDRLGCSASSSAASNDPQDRFFCPSSASSNDATTRTSCSNNPSPAGTSSGTTGTTAISTKRNNSKRRFPLPQAKAVVSFEDEVVHMQNKASPRPNSRPVMQDGEVLEALGLRKNARIKGGDSNLVDNSSSPESENTFHTGTSNSSDNSRTTTTTGHSSCLLKPLPHQIKKLRWITSSTSSSEEETEEQTAFSYRTNGTSNNSTSWKTGTEVTTSAAASPGTTGNMMDLFETAIRSRVGTTGASTETKYNMNTFAFS
ncbi:unnamed protein product [Amoebophrya sp. A25]|nr:unnamed protein product [Amoebophrya sp. A25]|eukprot:GSA25T00006032001.1